MVLCTALVDSSLGRQQQLVVFEFDEFCIGRMATVSVHDSKQFSFDPKLLYNRTRPVYDPQNATYNTSNWIIPGQRPSRYVCAFCVKKSHT